MPIDRGVTGWVCAHREAVALRDPAGDPRFDAAVDCLACARDGGEDDEEAAACESLLAVPLVNHDTSLLGAVVLLNKAAGEGAFSALDAALLTLHAAQVRPRPPRRARPRPRANRRGAARGQIVLAVKTASANLEHFTKRQTAPELLAGCRYHARPPGAAGARGRAPPRPPLTVRAAKGAGGGRARALLLRGCRQGSPAPRGRRRPARPGPRPPRARRRSPRPRHPPGGARPLAATLHGRCAKEGARSVHAVHGVHTFS